MKECISQTFLALLLFSGAAFAIGGQLQDDIICESSSHKGVGIVLSQMPGQATVQLGTFQILPQCDGILCLTAAHVLADGADIVAEIGDVSIKVKEIFKHPNYDVAILKLPCAFPLVEEEDLPFLPFSFDWTSKQSFMAECVGFGCTSSDDTTHYGQITGAERLKRKGSMVVKRERETFAAWWHPYDHHPYVYIGSGDSGGPLIIDHMLAGVSIAAHSNPEVFGRHMTLIDKAEYNHLQELNAPCIAMLSYYGHDVAYAFGDIIESKVKVYINKDIVDVEEVIEFNSLLKYIQNEVSLLQPSEKPEGFQFAQRIIDYLLSVIGVSSGFERKSVFQSLEPCLPWIREHIQKNSKITDA